MISADLVPISAGFDAKIVAFDMKRSMTALYEIHLGIQCDPDVDGGFLVQKLVDRPKIDGAACKIDAGGSFGSNFEHMDRSFL